MFFMIGITTGRKDLSCNQMIICSHCGKYGRYSVYMTYTVLSLFFIPCFRWNRKYYVTTGCCGVTYRLDPETGRKIARGEAVEITPDKLTLILREEWGYGGGNSGGLVLTKRCSNCGFTTEEDYDYCPKCGKPL